MTYQKYIKALWAAVVMTTASACVQIDVDHGTSDGEISISPVTSMPAKSIPGAILGTTYPFSETMGIMAFYSKAEPGPWTDTDVQYAATNDPHIDKGEFGYIAEHGAWGGIETTLNDGIRESVEHNPYHWPENGSLVFAGFSPYYKFEAVNVENLTKEGKLKEIKNMVNFDIPTRTLSVTGYTVGQYIPMTGEQIADPDHEYINTTQSDAMFFMPQVVDGEYVGVNKLSAYPARFYHALSLVEFKVRAEDYYDMDRIHIDHITLGEVYHTGDFSATVNDDGSISAKWDNLIGQKDIHIFGDDGGHDGKNELLMDMDLRSVAQLLIIPGPTHPITVGCHIYTMGKYYDQTFVVEPKDVGITNWEIGKRYVYNLIIGINKIEFSSRTYDWNDVDGGGIASQQKTDNQ